MMDSWPKAWFFKAATKMMLHPTPFHWISPGKSEQLALQRQGGGREPDHSSCDTRLRIIEEAGQVGDQT
jgi:hypothetical protein